jgi:4-amino-4-deoxy-L-arabinose transferase-like glycosyltransferase
MKNYSNFNIVFIWLALVLIGLSSRSYFPIDETRYVTVAWNMWLDGNYWVPHLNGEAYSHKPPLLFWLINLGWSLGGVNDWWPRLVPSLFALATIFMTQKIANRLWPQQLTISYHAALVLIASGLWVIYTTALMFDMLITFFTVLGLLGLLISYQENRKIGWLLFATAIGGGLLAKGPTILLQILPTALLAFWWGKNAQISFKKWYLPLILATLLGILIALVWAIPASIYGGKEYQHAIFWGQTADRMVNSFAHKRPFWWYAMLSPILLFPWLFWGHFWKSVISTFKQTLDSGTRFCLAWFVPVFIAFSFISGKQVHYILPLFPAFALLMAKCISSSKTTSKLQILPVVIATSILGIILFYLPNYLSQHSTSAKWLLTIPNWLGVVIVLSSILLFIVTKHSPHQTIEHLSTFSVCIVMCVMVVILNAAGKAYDVKPLSQQLKILETNHIPIAYIGTKYPGIFNFLGRLNHSPEIIPAANMASWFDQHPNGHAIALFKGNTIINASQVVFFQIYRGSSKLAILNHAQWQLLLGSQAVSTEQENIDE